MRDDLRKDGATKMTNPSDEELIEELERLAFNYEGSAWHRKTGPALRRAAERIRTLAAEREEAVKEGDDMAENAGTWCNRADEAYGQIDALQSRLLKAVEVVREIAGMGQSLEPDHWKFRCRAREIATALLQSIEAESGGEGSSRDHEPSTCAATPKSAPTVDLSAALNAIDRAVAQAWYNGFADAIARQPWDTWRDWAALSAKDQGHLAQALWADLWGLLATAPDGAASRHTGQLRDEPSHPTPGEESE